MTEKFDLAYPGVIQFYKILLKFTISNAREFYHIQESSASLNVGKKTWI